MLLINNSIARKHSPPFKFYDVCIYCSRLYFASVESLKSLLHMLHSSFVIFYTTNTPSYCLSKCKEHSTMIAKSSMTKIQCLTTHLRSLKWIVIFKNYMSKKMTFTPTSMCRVTLTLTPYFTGIFI